MKADELHTAHGLRALTLTGRVLRNEAPIHAKWIRGRLRATLRPYALVSEVEQLANVRLLLDGLSILNSRGRLQRRLMRPLAEKVAVWWHRSMQTERDARNLIQILDHVESGTHGLVQSISRSWLPSKERLLASMKPDSSLPAIVDLVWIIRRLYPDSYLQRDSVRQARSNLARVYGTHFPLRDVHGGQN